MPGFLEQLRRTLRVVRARPKRVVEGRIARCIKVIGHSTLTVERPAHQFLPVGQQTKCLPYPWIVKRRFVEIHVERQPVTGD
ncbi:hypothetical protein D3C72_2065100 [compost metagenome]